MFESTIIDRADYKWLIPLWNRLQHESVLSVDIVTGRFEECIHTPLDSFDLIERPYATRLSLCIRIAIQLSKLHRNQVIHGEVITGNIKVRTSSVNELMEDSDIRLCIGEFTRIDQSEYYRDVYQFAEMIQRSFFTTQELESENDLALLLNELLSINNSNNINNINYNNNNNNNKYYQSPLDCITMQVVIERLSDILTRHRWSLFGQLVNSLTPDGSHSTQAHQNSRWLARVLFRHQSMISWSSLIEQLKLRADTLNIETFIPSAKLLLADANECVSIYTFCEALLRFGPSGESKHEIFNFMNKIDEAVRILGFHGSLSTHETNVLLLSNSPGSYLVRYSNSSKHSFVLSFRSNTGSEVIHISIENLGQSYIEYLYRHTHYSLPATINGLCARLSLRSPVERTEFTFNRDSTSNDHYFRDSNQR